MPIVTHLCQLLLTCVRPFIQVTVVNRSVYRRSTALFEKIVGHPYDPADYDYDVIEGHGDCPDDEDGDKDRESSIEG